MCIRRSLPTCELRTEVVGRRLTVFLSGELDMSSTPALEHITSTAAGQFDQVVLDLAGLGFVDSSGINAFVALRRTVPDFTVRNASHAVRRPIETLGLCDHLGVR